MIRKLILNEDREVDLSTSKENLNEPEKSEHEEQTLVADERISSMDDVSLELENTGITSMLHSLVGEYFSLLDSLNSCVATLSDINENSPIIEVLDDIMSDCNFHIGELQHCLTLVDDASENIEDGAEKAKDTIEDSEEDKDEEEKEDDEENDDEKSFDEVDASDDK